MIPRFFSAVIIAAQLGGLGATAEAAGAQRFHVDSVPAPSLRSNLFGDPAVRTAAIYLPESYSRDSKRRFPVIYILHGFGGGFEPFVKRIGIERFLDSLTRRGALQEMIVVVPDANNRLTGAFARNSVVTGRWEDFLAKDLVTYIDSHYRTIRSRKARGIAGWSAGGYGALYLGARHSKTFSAVYSLSACCLMSDLPSDTLWRMRGREALRAEAAGKLTINFNANIATALGTIYTPAPAKAPLFVRFPWEGQSAVVVDSIAAFWRDTPLEIIRRTPAKTLQSVRWAFDAGDQDAFSDIPGAGAELHRILNQKGVPHTFEIFSGTHGDRIRERVETRLLPFFSRALSK